MSMSRTIQTKRSSKHKIIDSATFTHQSPFHMQMCSYILRIFYSRHQHYHDLPFCLQNYFSAISIKNVDPIILSLPLFVFVCFFLLPIFCLFFFPFSSQMKNSTELEIILQIFKLYGLDFLFFGSSYHAFFEYHAIIIVFVINKSKMCWINQIVWLYNL